jgi:hypothetical protein
MRTICIMDIQKKKTSWDTVFTRERQVAEVRFVTPKRFHEVQLRSESNFLNAPSSCLKLKLVLRICDVAMSLSVVFRLSGHLLEIVKCFAFISQCKIKTQLYVKSDAKVFFGC